MAMRKAIWAVALAVGAALLTISAPAPAAAQGPACAPADLACRIAALEARVAALEGAPRQAAPEAAPEATTAPAPQVIYQSPTETIRAARACRTDCRAEAAELCASRGFAGGAPQDWERPRSGPVRMTSARCERRAN
ncbi:MAG: hypothetical protein AB7O04_14695 [Hyphomonadaceae bacterium]